MSPAMLASRLNEAAQAGTPLTILYGDANRQTTHRVLPIAASNRVLRARDLVSNQTKVFLLTQLEILDEPDHPVAPLASAAAPAARRPSTREVLVSLVDELKHLGWHVTLSRSRLSVHPSYSSGKPMNIAAAYIAHTSRFRRPWTVVAPGMPKARTFATRDRAVDLFMTHVRLHAPALRERRRRTTPKPPRQ
jgi:hypothetical protein